ncbi:AIPR protein [Chitinophaga jiangningensis]|uniref:AIPR protein n=1 Tax=Chitinophaga jiangningensis TaxID=1419482 RepID=A0A1M7FJW4_9BACT|nr:AIPR family protein [Chitinophaga jiangningensis]SHM04255.1 AIPR protein [Chitinophaga jiangningensis]
MSLKVLLEDQITKLFSNNPELSTSQKNRFEIAVASFANFKILNGLEFDDLLDGIMGDGGDEGIDHCYIFCNGVIVKDEDHPITSDSTIKVKFFQTKKEDGISTDGFRKMVEGIKEIFNLELELSELQNIGANQEIIEMADLLRKIFRRARLENAKFSCEVYYVTATAEVKVSEKIKLLEKDLKNLPTKIPFEFEYWGAQKLIDLSGRRDEELNIIFESQPLNISEKNSPTSGYTGFVNGNELMQSLIDNEGNFKSHLTEGNVRFFLGENTRINSSIIDTALDPIKAANFWAMNNGLTIIGESIKVLDAKEYTIVNPQIVNGCQTIHCLNDAYNKANKQSLPSTLKVFVKIVQTNNIDTQGDIISATNSQNPVKSASLKANDNIQRNIEKHLKEVGIFYERRDNYYKRQGFTGNKVIGLLKMAQIMHTVVNKEAVVAANDTTTLFDSATKYNSIFNDKADFDLYKFSTVLYQKIWSLKNSDLRNNDYPSDKKEQISKGGFIFLHIMSSLLFSDAEIVDGGKVMQKPLTGILNIESPARKNEFTKRKAWLLAKLNDEESLNNYYEKAKLIFQDAIDSYTKTGKAANTLFKSRNFDKDFLRPTVDAYIEQK